MAFKMKAGKEGPMRKNFGSKYSPMNKIKDKVTTSESDLGNIVKSQKDKEMGKSDPFDKALVGNQKNLPEHLKKKIEAAPESPMQKDDPKIDDTRFRGEEKTVTNPLTGKTRTTRKFTDSYGNKKKRVSVTDKYGKETKYKSKTEKENIKGDVRKYKQKGDKTVYSGRDVELGRGLYRSSSKPPRRGYN
jgi:hypothetical protein